MARALYAVLLLAGTAIGAGICTMTGIVWATEAEPSSPGGEILFYGEQGRTRQLFLLELESGQIRPVGRSGSRPDHYPQWSPDGKRIVFESYRRGGWHSWVMDADGDRAQRVSNLPGGDLRNYEFDASFAPDSKGFILVRDFDLYEVASAGGTPRRLGKATPSLYETAPVYSPNGRRIAFSAYRSSDKSVHLYTVARDGSDLQQLTSGEAWHLAPAWSPTGDKLLFYSNRAGSFELFEIGPQGGTAKALLQPAAAKRAGFTKTALVDPWDNDNGATLQYRASYSPDGQWIVFSREVEGDRELFLSNRQGTEIRRLTRRQGHDGMPAWRPQVKPSASKPR